MARTFADVVVVGNGSIGLSIAYEMARRGHKVSLLGEASRPYAASAAAGAMLGCFGEVTTSLVASPSGRAKLEADYRAREEWPEWDSDLSAGSGDPRSLLTRSGTYVILNSIGTSAVDSGNFRAIIEALRKYDEPYELIDAEQIPWLKPDELARSFQAISIPHEHAVDAARLLTKLDKSFRQAGGRVVDAAASSVVFKSGRAVGVRTTGGELVSSDGVVIAAGVRSLELLDGIEEIRRMIPPIVSGYGVSALMETKGGNLPPAVIRTPNRAFACGLHCIPRGDGVLYVGGTNVLTDMPRSSATVRDLQFLLECAVDQLYSGLPEAGIRAVQVGNRPVPADGFPLIGSPGVDNLWLATGTYRDGLHQSPLIAKALVGLIEGAPDKFEFLSDFTPVRKPLATGSRQDIVEATVDQMMASGYETRWRLTPEWPKRIEQHFRREYAEAVERLHPRYTPPPEFVAKMNDPIRQSLRAYYNAWS